MDIAFDFAVSNHFVAADVASDVAFFAQNHTAFNSQITENFAVDFDVGFTGDVALDGASFSNEGGDGVVDVAVSCFFAEHGKPCCRWVL